MYLNYGQGSNVTGNMIHCFRCIGCVAGTDMYCITVWWYTGPVGIL